MVQDGVLFSFFPGEKELYSMFDFDTVVDGYIINMMKTGADNIGILLLSANYIHPLSLYVPAL